MRSGRPAAPIAVGPCPVSSFTTGPDEHEGIVADRTEASFGKIERLAREHERRIMQEHIDHETKRPTSARKAGLGLRFFCKLDEEQPYAGALSPKSSSQGGSMNEQGATPRSAHLAREMPERQPASCLAR